MRLILMSRVVAMFPRSGRITGCADTAVWLLTPAKEMSLRRPYGTPEVICGVCVPRAQQSVTEHAERGDLRWQGLKPTYILQQLRHD